MTLEAFVKSAPVTYIAQTTPLPIKQSDNPWKEYRPINPPNRPPHPHDPPIVPEASTYGLLFMGISLSILMYRRYIAKSQYNS